MKLLNKIETGDLWRYFRFCVVPTLIFFVTAVYLSYQYSGYLADSAQKALDGRRQQLMREVQEIAADTELEPVARARALLEQVTCDVAPTGVFVWTPKKILWSQGVGEDVLAEARKKAFFKDWGVESQKRPKRSDFVRWGADGRWTVAWARGIKTEGSIYALVFDGEPVAVDDWHSLIWRNMCILLLVPAIVLVMGSVMLLRQALAARKKLEQQLTFLNLISHELNTPIAAIKLWAGFLVSGMIKNDPQEVEKAYKVVYGENEKMIMLVGDLLNMARLVRGKVEFQMGRMDLLAMAREEVEKAACFFSENGIGCDGEQGLVAEADVRRVQQILTIFLTNARKYAAKGGKVEVVACRHGERVRLEVRDRGPGLDRETQRHCFDLFWQAGNRHGMEGHQQGLGLGLAIARMLANGMGGEVFAANREGGGSVFALELKSAVEEKA